MKKILIITLLSISLFTSFNFIYAQIPMCSAPQNLIIWPNMSTYTIPVATTSSGVLTNSPIRFLPQHPQNRNLSTVSIFNTLHIFGKSSNWFDNSENSMAWVIIDRGPLETRGPRIDHNSGGAIIFRDISTSTDRNYNTLFSISQSPYVRWKGANQRELNATSYGHLIFNYAEHNISSATITSPRLGRIPPGGTKNLEGIMVLTWDGRLGLGIDNISSMASRTMHIVLKNDPDFNGIRFEGLRDIRRGHAIRIELYAPNSPADQNKKNFQIINYNPIGEDENQNVLVIRSALDNGSTSNNIIQMMHDGRVMFSTRTRIVDPYTPIRPHINSVIHVDTSDLDKGIVLTTPNTAFMIYEDGNTQGWVRFRPGIVKFGHFNRITSRGFMFSNNGDIARMVIMENNSSGTVGINTTSPQAALHVVGNILSSATITAPTITAQRFCIGNNCLTSWPSGGGLSGGQRNYLTKWTSATSVGTSTIFDNGTNIGIGTINPQSKLHVVGNILSSTASPYVIINRLDNTRESGIKFESNNSPVWEIELTRNNNLVISASTNEPVILLDNNRRVHIGSFSTGSGKFNVYGNSNFYSSDGRRLLLEITEE